MDKSILDYLNIIRETLNKQGNDSKYDYSNTDWTEVINLASSTSMLGIIFKRLKEIAAEYEGLKALLSGTEPWVMARGLEEVRKTILLQRLIKAAKEENVPVLLFKGVVLSSLYPEPAMRFSSDTDMFIDRDQRERMTDIFVRFGYKYDNEASNENVVKYLLPRQHYIELHSKLWSYVKGTKIDMLDRMELTNKRIHGVFDGVECDTIDFAEQLIFLMFHLYKHMMLDFANIRFVTDILLFFRAHYADMDLKLLKERMVALEYWDFFSRLYEIAIRFLGFERIPAMDELKPAPYDEEAAELIISELMTQNRDEFEMEHLFEFSYNIMPYLTGDNSDKDKSGKKGNLLQYIFPGAKNFPEHYSYVRKHPILLPVGWIHRLWDYSCDRLFRKEKRVAGLDRMNLVDAKMNRMRKMGLIK